MSSRARRLSDPAGVVRYQWDNGAAAAHAVEAPPEPERPAADQLAQVERDAFARGFAEGQASAVQVASDRAEATLRELARTLGELAVLRAEMIRRTERQMVELALAVARRIVHREVSIDRDLLMAMARVALDRLGESTKVTVRLHPAEYEAAGGPAIARTVGAHVAIVADPRVERGGCLVESDLGSVDAGVDAQIQEFARALLGEPQPDSGADALRAS